MLPNFNLELLIMIFYGTRYIPIILTCPASALNKRMCHYLDNTLPFSI